MSASSRKKSAINEKLAKQIIEITLNVSTGSKVKWPELGTKLSKLGLTNGDTVIFFLEKIVPHYFSKDIDVLVELFEFFVSQHFMIFEPKEAEQVIIALITLFDEIGLFNEEHKILRDKVCSAIAIKQLSQVDLPKAKTPRLDVKARIAHHVNHDIQNYQEIEMLERSNDVKPLDDGNQYVNFDISSEVAVHIFRYLMTTLFNNRNSKDVVGSLLAIADIIQISPKTVLKHLQLPLLYVGPAIIHLQLQGQEAIDAIKDCLQTSSAVISSVEFYNELVKMLAACFDDDKIKSAQINHLLGVILQVNDEIKFKFNKNILLQAIAETLLNMASQNKSTSETNDPSEKALDVVTMLLVRYQLDPFQAHTFGGKESSKAGGFFASIFMQILSLENHPLIKEFDEIPRHVTLHNNKSASMVVEIPIHGEDPVELLSYVLLLSELLPLISDPEEFNVHCNNLFPGGFLDDESETLRQALLNSHGIPSSDSNVWETLKPAVMQRLSTRKINAHDKNFPEAILKFLDKEVVRFYEPVYDATHHCLKLAMASSMPKEQEGSSSAISLIQKQRGEEVQYSFLMQARKFLSNIHAARGKDSLVRVTKQLRLQKLHYVLNALFQLTVNVTNIKDITKADYFSVLSNLLPQLAETPIFDQIMKFMLQAPATDNSQDEEKEDSLILVNTLYTQRVRAFFRSLASQQKATGKNDKFREAIRCLPLMHEHTDIDYYLLFVNNIDPTFFESLNPLAQGVFKANIANPDLLEMYADYEAHPSVTHLIQLINLPVNNLPMNVILPKINRLNRLLAIHPAQEREFYRILRTLFQVSSVIDGGQDQLQIILDKLENIFKRFSNDDAAWVQHQTLVSAAISKPDCIEQLDAIIAKLRLTHVLIEEVDSQLEEILESSNADKIFSFVQMLNERQLTSQLTKDDHSKKLLQRILQCIETGSLPQTRKLVHTLTQSPNPLSRVDFSTTTAENNSSWSEFFLSQPNLMIRVASVLLATDLLKEEDIVLYLRAFLNKITDHPDFLRHEEAAHLFMYIINTKIFKFRVNEWQEKSFAEIPTSNAASSSSSHVAPIGEQKFQAIVQKLLSHGDNISLKELAHWTVKIKRLDLLAIIDQFTPAKLWTTDTSLFEAIHHLIKVPMSVEQMRIVITWPLFFTSHYQLINVFTARDAFSQTCLATAMSTSYQCSSHIDDRVQFILAVEALRNYDNGVLTPVISKALLDHADALRRFDLNAVIKLLKILDLSHAPAGFPVVSSVDEIFSNSLPDQWQEKLSQLHTEMRLFKIKGMDPKIVLGKFKAVEFPLTQLIKQPKVKDPLHYFFEVFGRVNRMVAHYQEVNKDALSAEKASVLMQLYKDNMPGKFDINADTNFFGALCLASHCTIKKVPYHAQFATIMGTVYAIPHHKKLLGDVNTGQGKTLIIAFTSVCLVKIYNPSFVLILKLSENIAQENVAENNPFFDVFGITAAAGINFSNSKIRYTTILQLHWQLVNDDLRKVHGFRAILPNLKDAILGLDENDVYMDKRDEVLQPIAVEYPELTPFLKDLFTISQVSPREHLTKELILERESYQALPVQLKEHINEYFWRFYDAAKSAVNLKASTTANGSRRGFDEDTGIISTNMIGDYAEPQFIQMANGSAEIEPYSLPFHRSYYGDLLNKFSTVFGFSGTMGSSDEKRLYQYDGYGVFDTARFNDGRLIVPNSPIVIDGVDKWMSELASHASLYASAGRPVFVFVERPEEVDRLLASEPFKQLASSYKIQKFVGTENRDEQKQVVNKATDARQITVSQILGGRDVDYPIHDQEIDRAGGAVVLVGTLFASAKVEEQVWNRTARDDKQGLAISIFEQGQVNAFFKKAKIEADPSNRGIANARMALLKEKTARSQERRKEDKAATLVQDFYQRVLPTIPQLRREEALKCFAFYLFDANRSKADNLRSLTYTEARGLQV